MRNPQTRPKIQKYLDSLCFVIPTLRGTVMIFLAISFFFISMVNVNLIVALLTASIFGIIVSSFIFSFFSLHGINIEREPGIDGISDGFVIMPLKLINNRPFGRQALNIQEVCFFAPNGVSNTPVLNIAPRETRLIKRKIPSLIRGRYSLNCVSLIGGDPAGLFRRTKKFYLASEILVYPKQEKISALGLQKTSVIQTAARPSGMSGIGDEYFGIREYTSRDSMRQIHWKASAKQRKLMVKEYEKQKKPQVIIILDTEKKYLGQDKLQNNLEYLIEIVASLSDYLLSISNNITYIRADKDPKAPVIIEGIAFSSSNNIIDDLVDIKALKTPLYTLLNISCDYILPDSIIYCLSMSEPANIPNFFNEALDLGCEIHWLLAPSKYFPQNIEGIYPKPLIKKYDYNSTAPINPDLLFRGRQVNDIFMGNI